MPLVRAPIAFNHPDWIFELKHDGFRALADIRGHLCDLISRRGYRFPKFTLLAEELAHAMRVRSAILDGEVVCLGPDGRSRFYDLLFRRDWPYFVAFDALMIDDEDLTGWPLLERSAAFDRSCAHLPFRRAQGNDAEAGIAPPRVTPFAFLVERLIIGACDARG